MGLPVWNVHCCLHLDFAHLHHVSCLPGHTPPAWLELRKVSFYPCRVSFYPCTSSCRVSFYVIVRSQQSALEVSVKHTVALVRKLTASIIAG